MPQQVDGEKCGLSPEDPVVPQPDEHRDHGEIEEPRDRAPSPAPPAFPALDVPVDDRPAADDQTSTRLELPPEETFVLDYDQEIAFLRSEGRPPASMRPTGFKG